MGEAKRRRDAADTISVLIPERGRPEMLERLICSLLDTAGGDEGIEILVAIDNDDPAWIDREPHQHSRVRYLRRPRPPTLGDKLNDMAREARGGLLWFIANDQIMETKGWPAAFRTAAGQFPNGIGIAHPRDPLHPQHASYWLMTRTMVDAVGFFAPPWFPYWFCDTWWTEIGILLGGLVEIDADVAAPEGRGKCHGLIDLEFWVTLFDAMRQLRVRDAINLAQIAALPPAAVQEIPQRASRCAQMTAHLKAPGFIRFWSAKADSEPAPQYAEVRAYAERLLADLRAAQPRPVRVTICCPGQMWQGATGSSVAAVAAHAAQSGIGISILNAQGSMISQVRNSTVELALAPDLESDYLMWIDSDMKLPPDTLVRLLSHGKDIVGATYHKRTPPYAPLGMLKGPPQAGLTGGLHEALLMPGGVMLVKADVYRKIGFPWYFECYTWPGASGRDRFKALLSDYLPDAPPAEVLDELDHSVLGAWLDEHYHLGERGDDFSYWSEDLSFCRKARKHGYSIWCDLDLTMRVSHLGTLEVDSTAPKSAAAHTGPSSDLDVLKAAAD